MHGLGVGAVAPARPALGWFRWLMVSTVEGEGGLAISQLVRRMWYGPIGIKLRGFRP